MAARTLPRPNHRSDSGYPLKAMPAREILAALTSMVLALCALAFAWHRINAASATSQDHVNEIFRPSRLDAIPCNFSTQPRLLMILVLGQSNAGNHGSSPPNPDGRIKTNFFFDGLCYRTGDAAPGATGRGGNIWTTLAPRLSRAVGRPVVFSVLAVEAAEVRDWIAPGKLKRRLTETLDNNRSYSFIPELVFWQQGEADAKAGTTGPEYRERLAQLAALLRSHGVSAPIIAALSTRCRNEGSDAIRTVLRESAAFDPSIRLGPDTDTLVGSFRNDGCHFSASGLDAAAELWLPAAIASLPATQVNQAQVAPSNPR